MKRILIAGMGNIFLGDDAFGCEVVRHMGAGIRGGEVEVQDFGIRGYELACALANRFEAVILVDAVSRGREPGTVFLLEPETGGRFGEFEKIALYGHSMNPVSILHMARTLGDLPARLYLVGCEPAVLEREGGGVGLSPSVQEAVPRALGMIRSLVEEILNKPGHAVAA
jgi:hydrogenase maturation protease